MQRHIVVCHASTNERCFFALPWPLAACHATTHRYVPPTQPHAAASRFPGPSLCVMQLHFAVCHASTNERLCFALLWPLAVSHATTLRCVSRQHKRAPLFRAPFAPRCVSCYHTSVCVMPAQTNAFVSRSPRPSLCVTHRHTPTMFPRAPLASLRAVCHT